ncbi:MAG: DUF2189 domain-containing protein [Gammaproteobacteria bacterium]|nr:DUF2189 domain-containing protein [Gammaproteobacteria bacterium]
MVSTTKKIKTDEFDSTTMPFVASCKIIEPLAPFRWLRQGWADMMRARKQSLSYGLVMTLISYFVTIVAYLMDSYMLLFALLSAFFFLGPVLAIGLYSISCQLQEGKSPRLGYCLREGRRHIGNGLVFAFVLLIIFLIWARAASMVHIFFPEESSPHFADLLVFLGIGTVIGAFFCAIIFTASVFSLPMIMDRKVDVITAVITSVNAVFRNKLAMLVWAGIIVLSVLLSIATAFIGMTILLPLIGHATWYGYKETIDADLWPRYEPLDQ